MYYSRPLPGTHYPAAKNSPFGSDSLAAFSGNERQAMRGLIGCKT